MLNFVQHGTLEKTSTGYLFFNADGIEVGRIRTERKYVAALQVAGRRFMFGREELIGKSDSALWVQLLDLGKAEQRQRGRLVTFTYDKDAKTVTRTEPGAKPYTFEADLSTAIFYTLKTV